MPSNSVSHQAPDYLPIGIVMYVAIDYMVDKRGKPNGMDRNGTGKSQFNKFQWCTSLNHPKRKYRGSSVKLDKKTNGKRTNQTQITD